jgi:hypothetical protein
MVDDTCVAEHIIEDRVLDLSLLLGVPADALEPLVDDWPGDRQIPVSVVEEWLEDLPARLGGLTTRQWASACAHVLPEAYREPLRPHKQSAGVPRSKAKLAAMVRRAAAGCGLFHPLDTNGVDHQQTLFGTAD